MADDDNGGRRRSSGVLDAIFDAVEERPSSATAKQGSIFRARALEQVDVPVQVDNLLPLTPARLWLALGAIGLVIVAFVAYAAVTVTVVSVSGTGRAVASPGLVRAVSPAGGILADVTVASGAAVTRGAVIASGTAADGSVLEVRAPIDGTLWQALATRGETVLPGAVVATILPPGSDAEVLVALDESDAAAAAGAVEIRITDSNGAQSTGTISGITDAPIPSAIAEARIEQPLGTDQDVDVVSIRPTSSLAPGAAVEVTFVLSESTLLQQIIGLS